MRPSSFLRINRQFLIVSREQLMGLYSSLRLCGQLLREGKRDSFFSSIATGKVPVVLEITPHTCSCQQS